MSHSKLRLTLIIIAGLLALYTIVGFFVLPAVVKSQLTQRLSAELGRQVSVEKVSINPFAFSVSVEKLDIKEADGKTSCFGWDRLYVDAGLFASLTGDWTLTAVELDGMRSRVVLNADGSFNFSDVLAKLTASSAPKKEPAPAAAVPVPAVRLDTLRVTGASLDISDNSRATPFHTILGPMHVSLDGFRLTGGHEALYQFEAVTETGEKLSWKGGLLAMPATSTGEFSIENLHLKKYAPYYESLVRADLADGKLSLRGRYELSLAPSHRVMKLVQGAVQLRDLRVVEKATETAVVELPKLDVTGINADALTMKATVDSVAITGGHLAVRRQKDGTINLLAMLPKPAAAPALAVSVNVPAAAAPAAKDALPDVTISEFSLQGFAIDIADQTTPRPTQLSLSAIKMNAANLGLLSKAAMPVNLSFDWAPKGKVEVQSDVTINPAFAVQLKTTVSDFDLLPLSAYLEQFVNVRISRGSLSTQLEVKAALADGKPDATVSGNLSLDSFDLVDGLRMRDLAGFSHLELKGIKASTLPQLNLALDELIVASPHARVSMATDGTINFASLKKQGTAAAAPAAAAAATQAAAVPAASAALPKISVGKITVSEGDFSFSDHSIQPVVRVALKSFGGTIVGLSSDNPTKADVDLKGNVDGLGLVAVTGKLDPLAVRKSVDVKIDIRDIDLVPLSPYTGKYAGYELARGKLKVDVKAKLDDRNIDVTNLVVLDQFTFGNASNSPEATTLPVRLGVSLLKDIDGKIVIDLPVKGSLDDPNFKIGKVVWRVVGNLLTKAAVSPFSLIGSMFGGGGDELGYQQFAPGSYSLMPEESKKLDTVIKALTNRPGLSVDIEGSFDPVADRAVLKQALLERQLRKLIMESRHAADPSLAPTAQITPTPEENEAMIRKLFAEKFPQGSVQAAPVKAPVQVEARKVERPRSRIKRLVDFITFRSLVKKESASTEKEAPVAADTTAQAGVQTGPSLPEMSSRLAETMTVSEDTLRAIATSRAKAVRDHLAQVGKIAPERLFLSQGGSGTAKEDKGAKVMLTLR